MRPRLSFVSLRQFSQLKLSRLFLDQFSRVLPLCNAMNQNFHKNSYAIWAVNEEEDFHPSLQRLEICNVHRGRSLPENIRVHCGDSPPAFSDGCRPLCSPGIWL